MRVGAKAVTVRAAKAKRRCMVAEEGEYEARGRELRRQ